MKTGYSAQAVKSGIMNNVEMIVKCVIYAGIHCSCGHSRVRQLHGLVLTYLLFYSAMNV